MRAALTIAIVCWTLFFVVRNGERGSAIAVQQCQYTNVDCPKTIRFLLAVVPSYEGGSVDEMPIFNHAKTIWRKMMSSHTRGKSLPVIAVIDALGNWKQIAISLGNQYQKLLEWWAANPPSPSDRTNDTIVRIGRIAAESSETPVAFIVLKTLPDSLPTYDAETKDVYDFVYVSIFGNAVGRRKQDVSDPARAFFTFKSGMDVSEADCTIGKLCHLICRDLLGASVKLTCVCPDKTKSYWSWTDISDGECKTKPTCYCTKTSTTESAAETPTTISHQHHSAETPTTISHQHHPAETPTTISHQHHPKTPKAWAFLLIGSATIGLACFMMILAGLMRSKRKAEAEAAPCATTRNTLKGVGKNSCAKVANVKKSNSSSIPSKTSVDNTECDSYGISASDYRKLMGVDPPKKTDKNSIMMMKKWLVNRSQSSVRGISKSTDLVVSKLSTKISKSPKN